MNDVKKFFANFRQYPAIGIVLAIAVIAVLYYIYKQNNSGQGTVSNVTTSSSQTPEEIIYSFMPTTNATSSTTSGSVLNATVGWNNPASGSDTVTIWSSPGTNGGMLGQLQQGTMVQLNSTPVYGNTPNVADAGKLGTQSQPSYQYYALSNGQGYISATDIESLMTSAK